MSHAHLTDERIQEWLDGRLSEREGAQVESHLDACERCRAEADLWSSLMADLSSLPELDPGHGLRGRVLGAVSVEPTPAALPWAARARAKLADLFGASAHPDATRLEALLTGALPRRQSIRLREHVDGCDSCRLEARAWSAVLVGLDALPRMAPSEGFGDAVLARLRVAESASAMAPARVGLARRAVARARSLVGPGRRRAWAAAAGVALTPATVVGLVAYAIFSHPLVTLGNLGSFVWLKGGAAAGALGGGLTSGLTQNAALFRAWSLVDTMTRTPLAAGTGLLAFTVLTAMAVWVLYRNLFSASARPAYARTRN